jgi:pyroglutamyl-peptidase
MSTILLTGFQPFGGHHTNPSQQIAERLHGEVIGGARVIGITLPVAFAESTDLLTAEIAEHKPTLVLSLGLAAGSTCLEVERFAVNLRVVEPGDPALPQPRNAPQTVIATDGMTALFSTIDAERVATAIRAKADIPALAHSYAGAYACNSVFYQSLHYALQWDLHYCAGFIHLPLSSEQAIAENKMHQASLPLESMVAAVRVGIEDALQDIN